MASRLVVSLSPEERTALDKLSKQEMRDPREQIRFILREEMHRRGYLDGKTRTLRQYSPPEGDSVDE